MPLLSEMTTGLKGLPLAGSFLRGLAAGGAGGGVANAAEVIPWTTLFWASNPDHEAPADGAVVGPWPDSMGFGTNLIAQGAGNVLYREAGWDGSLPTFENTGSSYLKSTMGTPDPSSPMTVIVIAEPTATGGFQDLVASPRIMINNTRIEIFDGGGGDIAITSGNMVNNEKYLLVVEWAASPEVSRVDLNGTTVYNGSVPDLASYSALNFFGNGSTFFKGRMPLMGLIDRHLTEQERADLEAFAADSYGVAIVA